MERKKETGVEVTIGWIPEDFARLGKKLRLKDEENDTWEYGWIVTTIGGRRSRVEQQDRNRDHKTHRKGSDI